MTRILMYLLIASEFAAAAGWYAVQWKTHERRRENDLVSSLIYTFFSISYAAYGFESLNFQLASPIGYAADVFIAAILAFFIFKKAILMKNTSSKPKTK